MEVIHVILFFYDSIIIPNNLNNLFTTTAAEWCLCAGWHKRLTKWRCEMPALQDFASQAVEF